MRLPSDRIHEAVQTLQGVPLHVPFVQTESELVNVTAQMLRAGVMIDAVNPALHYRPNAFDAVGVDAVPGILTRTVVHRLMVKGLTIQSTVARMLVCED